MVYSEAGLFADQTGAFEIAQSGEEKYMQQVTQNESVCKHEILVLLNSTLNFSLFLSLSPLGYNISVSCDLQ